MTLRKTNTHVLVTTLPGTRFKGTCWVTSKHRQERGLIFISLSLGNVC